ncbi:MAG: DUF5615 family PIN-like protein [Nitrospirota bacterium]|nr:DUF5615 family PIN-like protein [Nitrospirota bacterium]
MKILVDENIPKMTVQSLLEENHDVRDIRGSKLEGLSDNGIWELAQKENRVLITTDKGFMHYRHHAHQGILIIRLKQPNRLKIHQRIMKAIAQFNEIEWKGLMVVIRDKMQSVSRSPS